MCAKLALLFYERMSLEMWDNLSHILRARLATEIKDKLSGIIGEHSSTSRQVGRKFRAVGS